MAWSRMVSIAVAAGFATVAAAGPVSAQALGPVPVHSVTLTASEPGMTIVVQDKSYKQRIIECGERCALQLPTGDYKLVLRDPQGTYWTQRLSVAMACFEQSSTSPTAAAQVAGTLSMHACWFGVDPTV